MGECFGKEPLTDFDLEYSNNRCKCFTCCLSVKGDYIDGRKRKEDHLKRSNANSNLFSFSEADTVQPKNQ